MRFLIVLLMISCTAYGQENEKVMMPVKQLFEGMKKGDSAMVHAACYKMQTLSTATLDPKTNQPVLRTISFSDFLKAIGTPHKDVYNELIWAPKIEIDGNFAQVWVNYAFYAGSTFSHCGVDAFHLFRNAAGEWKIFGLSDTRQKEDCKVPKEVSERVK
jgi:hypothetical protein